MTADTGKNILGSLPNGPSSLCFNKDEFMKESFDVDEFIMECKRRVPLETLRDDLGLYLKILRTAMIELINKDYADFVNLSTNLVGMDKAITNLTVPLGQLKEEVLTVRCAMDDAIGNVEELLAQRQLTKQKKACLQRLVNITQSVEKIEKLLKVQYKDDEEHTGRSQLSGQLIERVATEFNKLQFYVTKSGGLPLVENIKPRISHITSTLQYSLQGLFLDGMESGNIEILRQCLRTYALIDKIKDVEKLFRQHVVRPYMEEVITEQYMRTNQGLSGMYTKILDFVPVHCKLLKEVTVGGSQGDNIRGYDFIVNAVWVEIVSSIEARTPTIFAPGNPNAFHEKYTRSQRFVSDFEELCGSQASVSRLRDHPSYHTFMSKWSLPVYFQIRFQEIAGAFESCLFNAFNTSTDNAYHLQVSSVLWSCVQSCWSDNVYIPALCHRIWKLTLQLLSRYESWLRETFLEQVKAKSSLLASSSDTTRRSLTPVEGVERSRTPVERPVERARTPDPKSTHDTDAAPSPVTPAQIVCLLADAELIATQLIGVFETVIHPKIETVGPCNEEQLKGCFIESQQAILAALPAFTDHLIEETLTQCAVYLKHVNDIPRLYRRTNKEVPSKPSTYVTGLTKPLTQFLNEHSHILGVDKRVLWATSVCDSVAKQYYTVISDVLVSVKKMEDSLKRLKRARGTGPSSGSQGMTDDDKIRQQLIIDIDHFGEQVVSLGVKKNNTDSFTKLQELSETAKSSMHGAPSST